jgi:hypothetical protein
MNTKVNGLAISIPRMIAIAENIGDSYHTRLLATYRFLFDQTREFKRHPALG